MNAGARFLNERGFWGAASSTGNGEDGREADVTGLGRKLTIFALPLG
jgi:hypothetical protein